MKFLSRMFSLDDLHERIYQLTKENKHLKQRVTELQEANNREVERRRATLKLSKKERDWVYDSLLQIVMEDNHIRLTDDPVMTLLRKFETEKHVFVEHDLFGRIGDVT